MERDRSRDGLTIPAAVLAETQAEAEKELQRARELGLPDADADQPMTDEYRQTVREKIARGLASARQGKLVDGPSVFARIRAEMAEIEQQGRR